LVRRQLPPYHSEILLQLPLVVRAAGDAPPSGLGHEERGTTSLATSTCTISPCWLRVSLRTVAMPRSGCDRDGLSSRTSLSTWSTSPGRIGLGQLISAPA